MHNIVTLSYPISMPQSEIMSKVDEYVHSHGSGWGTDCVRFLDGPIQDSESDAQEVLRSNADNHYGGYAVRFYDCASVSTKETNAIQKQIESIMEKKSTFIKTHSIATLKAAFISCPNCASKLNKSKLNGQKCPLCYADLRSKSILEKIKGYDEKINALYLKKINIAKSKAEVKWLVRFEYNS